MLTRPRASWLAGPGSILMVLVVTGAVLGANVLTTTSAPEAATDPLVVDTTATWEDIDGNGIDDDCQDAEAVADPEAALAAFTAADTDGDGTISVSEAARSGWIGGKNCNHGGFVSFVANQLGEDEETEEPAEEETDEETEEPAEACVATEVPPFDPETMTGPGAFGAYVSSIAKSDAVGGKNCNHGGAVSDAVHAAKELAKEARDKEKAERKAERDAAKAERDAAKAERDAAKAEKGANKDKGKSGD